MTDSFGRREVLSGMVATGAAAVTVEETRPPDAETAASIYYDMSREGERRRRPRLLECRRHD